MHAAASSSLTLRACCAGTLCRGGTLLAAPVAPAALGLLGLLRLGLGGVGDVGGGGRTAVAPAQLPQAQLASEQAACMSAPGGVGEQYMW